MFATLRLLTVHMLAVLLVGHMLLAVPLAVDMPSAAERQGRCPRTNHQLSKAAAPRPS